MIIDTCSLNVSLPIGVSNYFKNDVDFSDKIELILLENLMKTCISMKEVDYSLGLVGKELYQKYGSKDYFGNSLKVSLGKSISLALKFFDYYDVKLLKYFKDLIDNGFIFSAPLIEEGITSGFTATLSSQRESVIIVHKKESIELASTLIHETFHSYVESFLHDISFEKKALRYANNLDEVITNFSEIVFIQFLKDIKFDNKSIQYLESMTDDFLIYMLEEYSFRNDIPLEEYLENYNVYRDSEGCTYGLYLAYQYFNSYLHNDNKTKNDILDFSLETANKEKLYLLDNYGLSLEGIKKKETTERVLKKHMGY